MTRTTLRAAFAAGMLAILLTPSFIHARWPAYGAPVCTAYNSQSFQVAVSDGSGGIILVWRDLRSGFAGTSFDIYAQRVDAQGNPLWQSDGVAVCTQPEVQDFQVAASDGLGGVIVAWRDVRSGVVDVYVQRISASGTPMWTLDGVAVGTAGAQRDSPAITTDGAGGAIIVWRNLFGGSDLFAQRVNASGVLQWGADGVVVSTIANSTPPITIVSDGAGGAIFAWNDSRNFPDTDIFAQRVDASGTPLWSASGVALCLEGSAQAIRGTVSDGAGGAIVIWVDPRFDDLYSVFAQRVDGAGVTKWQSDGLRVADKMLGDEVDSSPTAIGDGAGGVFVAWVRDNQILAQRVSGLGERKWTSTGVIVSPLPTAGGPVIVSDGTSGTIIGWSDSRLTPLQPDVFAQKLDANGAARWDPDGVPVTTAANSQALEAAVADGAGGALFAWYDSPGSGGTDLYCQRVESRFGFWGRPEPMLAAAADVPADQGGKIRLSWYGSDADVLNEMTISHYSIWRALEEAPPAATKRDLAEIGRGYDQPAWRSERIADTEYFWELIGTQSAIYRDAYSFTASTPFDSISTTNADHYFQIVSHAYESQYLNWPSNVLSGHSVDNLAPPAPLLLTANRAGADVALKWRRVRVSDFQEYRIYRATVAGVSTVPANWVAAATDTLFIDAGAPAGPVYYVVTATDVHENASKPSNEVSVSGATGIGNLPPINRLTVLAHYPNPVSSTASVDVGLPAPSAVEITLFDVSGRKISRSATSLLPAGWRRLDLAAQTDGRPLPNGVYFYRVSAAGESITRKLVVIR